MRKLILLTVITAFVGQLNARPFPGSLKKEMREKVTEACRHAWQGYKDYAWG